MQALGVTAQGGIAPDDIVTVTPMRVAKVIAHYDASFHKPQALRWGLGSPLFRKAL